MGEEQPLNHFTLQVRLAFEMEVTIRVILDG